MSTATLRLQYKAVQKRVSGASAIHINVKVLYLLAALCCLVMLVSYVVRISELTKGAYLIKNYNREINSLTAENRRLQNSFAQSDFLVAAQEKARSLDFQKTTEVTYLQVSQSPVAKAK